MRYSQVEKLDRAYEATEGLLRSLTPQDTFNLMLFNMWLVMAGGRFWLDDDRTKIGVNSAEGLRALQFQLDMIYEDKTSQPPSGV